MFPRRALCLLLAAACFSAPAALAQVRRVVITSGGETVTPATPAAPAAPAPKVPAPSAEDIAKSLKLINEIYGSDIAAAKTPAAKAALATKMLASAEKEKDNLSRYAILTRTRDFAADIPHVDITADAVRHLDAGFKIDAKTAADAVSALYKTGRVADKANDQSRQLVDFAGFAAALAVRDDRYPVARQMIDIAIAVAKPLNDASLTKNLTEKSLRLKELEVAFGEAKTALATIADKPSDAEANLKAGKFFCLIKGDWDQGLPMLALGSDAGLRAAATTEMSGGKTPEDQAKIADAWWDLAEKYAAAPPQQFRIRAHADVWYQKCVEKLTGLPKTKVEKRISTVSVDRDKFPDILTTRLVSVFPLLKQNSILSGTWTVNAGTLVSDPSTTCRMQVPYRPPEEYDFRIDFTRTSGTDCLFLNLVSGTAEFAWIVGGYRNTITAFESVNSKSGETNPTAVKGGIDNGKKYEAVIKIRKDSAEAYINGKLINSVKGADFKTLSMSDYFYFPTRGTLGIGTYGTGYTIHRAEIVEITGKGAVVTTSPDVVE